MIEVIQIPVRTPARPSHSGGDARPGGGGVVMKLALRLASALLGIGLIAGCTVFSMDLKPKEGFEEKFVYGTESSSNKILLVPVTGLIMSNEDYSALSSRNVTTPQEIKELLMQAEKDDNIKAIIIEIDSPGGGVTASDIIYHVLREYKAKYPDKPIVALFNDTAASGGYYIAMAADYLVAHPTSITGSIGVISMFITVEDLLGKIGVETVVIKSGQAKDIGSPFRKMTQPEKEFMQHIIDQMYQRFVDTVYGNRKSGLSREELLKIADGRILTGEQALKEKLVDAMGYLPDAFGKAKELAKLPDARLIRYKKKSGILETAFRIESPTGQLQQLADFVLQSGTGKFMYLWMPAVIKDDR